MSAYSINIATNIENVLLFGATQHASELLKGEGSWKVDEHSVRAAGHSRLSWIEIFCVLCPQFAAGNRCASDCDNLQ